MSAYLIATNMIYSDVKTIQKWNMMKDTNQSNQIKMQQDIDQNRLLRSQFENRSG